MKAGLPNIIKIDQEFKNNLIFGLMYDVNLLQIKTTIETQ